MGAKLGSRSLPEHTSSTLSGCSTSKPPSRCRGDQGTPRLGRLREPVLAVEGGASCVQVDDHFPSGASRGQCCSDVAGRRRVTLLLSTFSDGAVACDVSLLAPDPCMVYPAPSGDGRPLRRARGEEPSPRSPLLWVERRDQILAITSRGGPHAAAWRRANQKRVARRRDAVTRFVRDELSSLSGLDAESIPAQPRLSDLRLLADLAQKSLAELMRALEIEDYERLDRRPPIAATWPRPRYAGTLLRERVGEVVGALRVLTGASVDVAGREIGRTHSHVRNIENGRYEPQVSDIVLMADAYNVTLATVLRLAA